MLKISNVFINRITGNPGNNSWVISVFGSPNQKIGDFTQTKIGGFS